MAALSEGTSLLQYARIVEGFHSFTKHTHAFIYDRNETYLPLSSQLKHVLIYRPQRDGMLSWPRHHHSE